MATVTIGQYAISQCDVKVKTSTGSTPTYSSIADLEELNLSIDSNVETWYSITDDGWQNALMTAKALAGSFSSKRTYGDAGNDYIDGLRLKNGKEAEADFQITFPNDDKLEFTAVVALTDWLGGATGVAPLNGDITGKGKPTFTPATA